MSKNTCIFIKSAVLLSYIATIAMNMLANILPLNNTTTGSISARYDTLFTPAGITFSIWGLIYVLLAIFVVRFLFYSHENHPKHFLAVASLFIISSATNITWLVAWHYDLILLSWIIIILLLVSLIWMVLTFQKLDPNPWHFENLTFGIYLGWISIATIANTSILLVKYNFSGWGISDARWTVIVISTAVLIAFTYTWRMRSATFSAVLFWALIGIAIRHFSDFNADYPSVIAAVAISMILLTSLTLTKLYLEKRSAEQRSNISL